MPQTAARGRGASEGDRPADPHRRHPGRRPPDAATLVRLMGQDKKVADGKLTFILARGIGDTFVSRDVSAEQVTAFLAAELAG